MFRLSQVILTGFLVLVCAGFAYSRADDIRVKSLSMQNGLSNSLVQCIVQDRYGFMWFGTTHGLNKFDGYDLKTYYYSASEQNSLPSSNIRSLYIDSQGNLWVGTTKGLCRYNPSGDNFETLLGEKYTTMGQFDIISILEDPEGFLWLAAYREGLLKYDPDNDIMFRYSHDPVDSGSISSNTIFSLFMDSRQNIWATTFDGGVNLFDRMSNSFIHFMHEPGNPGSLLGNNIHTMTEDTAGYLWFACNYAGLSSIHVDELGKRQFTNYTTYQGMASENARQVLSDPEEGIWIAYRNGLVDRFKNNEITHYNLNTPGQEFPTADNINVIYLDNQHTLWIGNTHSGINYMRPTSGVFITFRPDASSTKSLSHNQVWEFAEDSRATIWIATDGGGLNSFDPKSGLFTTYTTENSNIPTNHILSVYIDHEDIIWLGTWQHGIVRFDRTLGQFRSLNSRNSELSNDNVFDITEVPSGTLWLATQDGLNKLDKTSFKLESYTPANSDLLYHQMEFVKTDVYGNVLIGNVQGLVIYDPSRDEFTNYQHNPGREASLSDNFVTSICEQDSTILWIATNYGLNKFNRKTGEIRQFFMKDGLPSDMIFGVETDTEGSLWISTNRGLARYVDSSQVFENFGLNDGLQDYTFIKKSHFRASDGTLYFGGIRGFNQIHPERLNQRDYQTPMVFTELLVSNRQVSPNDETGILSQQIYLTESITLSHHYPGFSVKFSALDYMNSENIKYSYKLEGYDEQWNYSGNERIATYTNLDQGKYVLTIKNLYETVPSAGNIIKMQIRVLPPWWKTLLFKLLLVIILSVLVVGLYFIRIYQLEKQKQELERQVNLRTNELKQSNRELLSEQQKLQKANIMLEENHQEILAQKEEIENHRNHLESLVQERTSELEKAKLKAEESDRLKSAFLSNMSHEIRTPMNAIVGFASLLEAPNLKHEERIKYVKLVNNNCDALTLLINDIIDISLIQSNQLQLRLFPFHADMVLEELHDYFEAANTKKIEYIFENRNRDIDLVLENDPTRFKQILANLLSNAAKYTESGTIRFGYHRNKSEAEFFVSDTGVGIEESELENVFNYFHKIDPSGEKLYRGIGLGLSISKSLVELMGGKIWLESVPGEGSTFYFTLPVTGHHKAGPPPKPVSGEMPDLSTYSVVVAEDDPTNYLLVEKLLKPTQATVIWAKHGKEAVEAVNKIQDSKKTLVLMDIKMPVMNGIEALRILRLKSKELPIIAVTAYAQEHDRLEILKNNFNGYVSKPIHRDVLIRTIREALDLK